MLKSEGEARRWGQEDGTEWPRKNAKGAEEVNRGIHGIRGRETTGLRTTGPRTRGLLLTNAGTRERVNDSCGESFLGGEEPSFVEGFERLVVRQLGVGAEGGCHFLV